jgi:arginase/agmatinase
METIDRLKPDKPFYLSIDMDAFDASVAPAAVCPRYGGLKYMAVSEFIKKNANLIEGMDFSGICPLYDNGNTSMLAAQLIVDFLTHLK